MCWEVLAGARVTKTKANNGISQKLLDGILAVRNRDCEAIADLIRQPQRNVVAEASVVCADLELAQTVARATVDANPLGTKQDIVDLTETLERIRLSYFSSGTQPIARVSPEVEPSIPVPKLPRALSAWGSSTRKKLLIRNIAQTPLLAPLNSLRSVLVGLFGVCVLILILFAELGHLGTEVKHFAADARGYIDQLKNTAPTIGNLVAENSALGISLVAIVASALLISLAILFARFLDRDAATIRSFMRRAKVPFRRPALAAKSELPPDVADRVIASCMARELNKALRKERRRRKVRRVWPIAFSPPLGDALGSGPPDWMRAIGDELGVTWLSWQTPVESASANTGDRRSPFKATEHSYTLDVLNGDEAEAFLDAVNCPRDFSTTILRYGRDFGWLCSCAELAERDRQEIWRLGRSLWIAQMAASDWRALKAHAFLALPHKLNQFTLLEGTAPKDIREYEYVALKNGRFVSEDGRTGATFAPSARNDMLLFLAATFRWLDLNASRAVEVEVAMLPQLRPDPTPFDLFGVTRPDSDDLNATLIGYDARLFVQSFSKAALTSPISIADLATALVYLRSYTNEHPDWQRAIETTRDKLDRLAPEIASSLEQLKNSSDWLNLLFASSGLKKLVEDIKPDAPIADGLPAYIMSALVNLPQPDLLADAALSLPAVDLEIVTAASGPKALKRIIDTEAIRSRFLADTVRGESAELQKRIRRQCLETETTLDAVRQLVLSGDSQLDTVPLRFSLAEAYLELAKLGVRARSFRSYRSGSGGSYSSVNADAIALISTYVKPEQLLKLKGRDFEIAVDVFSRRAEELIVRRRIAQRMFVEKKLGASDAARVDTPEPVLLECMRAIIARYRERPSEKSIASTFSLARIARVLTTALNQKHRTPTPQDAALRSEVTSAIKDAMSILSGSVLVELNFLRQQRVLLELHVALLGLEGDASREEHHEQIVRHAKFLKDAAAGGAMTDSRLQTLISDLEKEVKKARTQEIKPILEEMRRTLTEQRARHRRGSVGELVIRPDLEDLQQEDSSTRTANQRIIGLLAEAGSAAHGERFVFEGEIAAFTAAALADADQTVSEEVRRAAFERFGRGVCIRFLAHNASVIEGYDLADKVGLRADERALIEAVGNACASAPAGQLYQTLFNSLSVYRAPRLKARMLLVGRTTEPSFDPDGLKVQLPERKGRESCALIERNRMIRTWRNNDMGDRHQAPASLLLQIIRKGPHLEESGCDANGTQYGPEFTLTWFFGILLPLDGNGLVSAFSDIRSRKFDGIAFVWSARTRTLILQLPDSLMDALLTGGGHALNQAKMSLGLQNVSLISSATGEEEPDRTRKEIQRLLNGFQRDLWVDKKGGLSIEQMIERGVVDLRWKLNASVNLLRFEDTQLAFAELFDLSARIVE